MNSTKTLEQINEELAIATEKGKRETAALKARWDEIEKTIYSDTSITASPSPTLPWAITFSLGIILGSIGGIVFMLMAAN